MSGLVLDDPKSVIIEINAKEYKIHPTAPKVMQMMTDCNDKIKDAMADETADGMASTLAEIIIGYLGDDAYKSIFENRVITIDDLFAVITHINKELINSNKLLADGVESDAMTDDTTEQAA